MELYVGIDVSKEKLDTHINDIGNGDHCFENSKAAIKKLITLLKNLQSKGHVIKLIICESTGGYEKLWFCRELSKYVKLLLLILWV